MPKQPVQSNQAEIDSIDLTNVLEFPLTERHEFKTMMHTHLQNLYLSYGKDRVVDFIMELEGLEQARPFLKRVA